MAEHEQTVLGNSVTLQTRSCRFEGYNFDLDVWITELNRDMSLSKILITGGNGTYSKEIQFE